ncbi:pyridoxamine 5'-phosphate oxidase family protein, partial [Singulisphaera rosea]
MRGFPSDVAFTPAVKAIQQQNGSRKSYAKVEQGGG